MRPAFLSLKNAQAVSWKEIPEFSLKEFRSFLLEELSRGARLIAFFAFEPAPEKKKLLAVLARDTEHELYVGSAAVEESFDSLSLDCPQAQAFERDIFESQGILPKGHPWLKPLRRSLQPGHQFFTMTGDTLHEVAVGPVHAGVIEPGHFRFQCDGEIVHHLEIALGYQHRGVERALRGGPNLRTLALMETAAGDTSIGHASAFCQNLEALANADISPRAQALRAIALELERLANHVGDLGALANDVAYLPTAAFCGRLRGDYLNLTAAICGSRLGRNFVRPGGVAFDVNEDLGKSLSVRLERAFEELRGAIQLLWDSPSVLGRFEGTGTLTQALALQAGLVGPPARACGIGRDVRLDFPSGAYAGGSLSIATASSGDVYARAFVRWLEIQHAMTFLREQLPVVAPGEVRQKLKSLEAKSLSISLIEGWRGEICHVAVTDAKGMFSAYKMFDPSLRNWMGLALSMRGQQISDFPLCNKSFNLSYCGHDL